MEELLDTNTVTHTSIELYIVGFKIYKEVLYNDWSTYVWVACLNFMIKGR